MKKGDVIGNYILTTDAREGGGHSQWAFAKKDGTEFFIKRFLAPTYPVLGSPGSARTKAAKQKRCEEFERHHLLVMRRLRPISGDGGNLVIAKDFFRDRAHYYKVTNKVDVSDIGPKQIAAMPRDDRILIMLTATRSLDTLHKAGLVHGDVKPENLLIKAVSKGFAIKVIDFDNCFPARNPPAPDQLVGDPAYYSPELLQYILGKTAGDQLDEKSDVFALGLVFWQYLAGQRPRLPDGSSYAAEAVQEGAVLSLPRTIKDRPLADLVLSMLAKTPSKRPGMGEVHTALKLARRSKPDDRRAAVPSEPPLMRVLRGKLFRKLGPASSTGAGFVEPGKEAPRGGRPAADPPPPGKLRGTLITGAGASGGRAASDSAPDSGAKDDKCEGKLRGSLLKRKE